MRGYTIKVNGVCFNKSILPGIRFGEIHGRKVRLTRLEKGGWMVSEATIRPSAIGCGWDVYAKGRTMEEAVQKAQALLVGYRRTIETGGMKFDLASLADRFEVFDVGQNLVLFKASSEAEAILMATKLAIVRHHDSMGWGHDE